MRNERTKQDIIDGHIALGIEFGSTRIKSVLVDSRNNVCATGVFSWENRYENKIWTYHLEDAINGLQQSFKSLCGDVRVKYDVPLKKIGAIGISGMMHGYIALDKDGNQIAPFLTWRNTNTAEASEKLTELFDFNIPLRWTISQLYQALLNEEHHTKSIDYVCTLAGYIHYILSGSRVVGIGEASGMFPINPETLDYDQRMIDKFNSLGAFGKDIRTIFPKVLVAGENAGSLTEYGAKILDPTGSIQAGIPMVPPEGDAGTGMVATNSVGKRTGNVSVGTSIFSMVVLDKSLSRLYRDIDIVTTPTGDNVAMVHCNNGTSDLDQWASLLIQFYECMGLKANRELIYNAMFDESLNADDNCGDIIYFNYLSGEPISGVMEGRPLLVRKAGGEFSFANFMKAQLYSVFCALAIGNRILERENVKMNRVTGHGGMFKSEGVAQKYLSAAMKTPVCVLPTAGEGGPYGMALLASFYLNKKSNQSLEEFLGDMVFKDSAGKVIMASEKEIDSFNKYMERYCHLLETEKSAIENF